MTIIRDHFHLAVKVTYTARSVIVGICGFRFGGNRHEALQNGSSKGLTLDFGFFARKTT
jgi:hypothetical protein